MTVRSEVVAVFPPSPQPLSPEGRGAFLGMRRVLCSLLPSGRRAGDEGGERSERIASRLVGTAWPSHASPSPQPLSPEARGASLGMRLVLCSLLPPGRRAGDEGDEGGEHSERFSARLSPQPLSPEGRGASLGMRRVLCSLLPPGRRAGDEGDAANQRAQRGACGA